MRSAELPLPPHFNPDRVETIWKVPYQERLGGAREWAVQHRISSAAGDAKRICLLLVDVQNTFCIPDFELYVGGRSGRGAVDDNRRLCEFIYRNLGFITQICATMDTHRMMQIFHNIFLLDGKGNHPEPFSLVSVEDIEAGKWKFNSGIAAVLGIEPRQGQKHLLHYVEKLREGGKYELTVWPYHAMLGGIGHALVAAVEEAIFFHAGARSSQPFFQLKGDNSLTEHYSVLRPEVTEGVGGEQVGTTNTMLIDQLLSFDAVLIAGQAKSHCIAWTVEDVLAEIVARDAGLAQKFYLLEDCTSPVVVPDLIDYTDKADESFQRFAAAGMHRVCSTEPLTSWLDI